MANPYDSFDVRPEQKKKTNPYDEFDSAGNPYDEFDKQPSSPRTISDTIKDTGVSLAKGVVGAGQGIVGLADIPTRGKVGQALDSIGVRPDDWQKSLDEMYSPAQQAANKRVEAADGFIDTAKAYLENPSTIAHGIVETIPSVAAGGIVGRGALAVGSRLAPKVIGGASKAAQAIGAGAAGEGLISAGQTAEDIRTQSDNRELSWEQSGLAAASGIATSAFGVAGGALAKRLGFADIDSLVTGLNPAKKEGWKGVVKSLVGGGISEGAFEEMPQSAQETIITNVALDRPWNEGLPESMAAGLILGGAMGTGANLIPGSSRLMPEQQPPQIDQSTGLIVPPQEADVLAEQPRLAPIEQPDETQGVLTRVANQVPPTIQQRLAPIVEPEEEVPLITEQTEPIATGQAALGSVSGRGESTEDMGMANREMPEDQFADIVSRQTSEGPAAFASPGAAKRAIEKQGKDETHEIVAARDAGFESDGYVAVPKNVKTESPRQPNNTTTTQEVQNEERQGQRQGRRGLLNETTAQTTSTSAVGEDQGGQSGEMPASGSRSEQTVTTSEQVATEKQPWEMTAGQYLEYIPPGQKKLVDNLASKTIPDVADKGKGFFVHWADGRAMVGFRNKEDAISFIRQGDRDAVSATYRDVKKGEKVRNDASLERDLAKSKRKFHREMVENALSVGDKVPPQVLADYPDLAAKVSSNKSVTPKPADVPGAQAVTSKGEASKFNSRELLSILQDSENFRKRRKFSAAGGPDVRELSEKGRNEVAAYVLMKNGIAQNRPSRLLSLDGFAASVGDGEARTIGKEQGLNNSQAAELLSLTGVTIPSEVTSEISALVFAGEEGKAASLVKKHTIIYDAREDGDIQPRYRLGDVGKRLIRDFSAAVSEVIGSQKDKNEPQDDLSLSGEPQQSTPKTAPPTPLDTKRTMENSREVIAPAARTVDGVGQKSFADAQQYDVYGTNIEGRGKMFAVRGDRPNGFGDELFSTSEEATAYATEKRKRDEANSQTREKSRIEKEAADKSEADRKEKSSKLTIAERRAAATLDKQHNLSGFQPMTRRELVESVVNGDIAGYSFEEREVEDAAAKKKDEEFVSRVRRNYILSPKDRTRGSNANIPDVKAAYEAIDRIEAGHKKKEYRLVDRDGRYFNVSKTEYDYSKKLLEIKSEEKTEGYGKSSPGNISNSQQSVPPRNNEQPNDLHSPPPQKADTQAPAPRQDAEPAAAKTPERVYTDAELSSVQVSFSPDFLGGAEMTAKKALDIIDGDLAIYEKIKGCIGA